MVDNTYAGITCNIGDDFSIDSVAAEGYDNGDSRQWWSKDQFTAYLDSTEVHFRVTVIAEDLAAILGDEYRGKVSVEMYLVPEPSDCCKETLDSASNGEGELVSIQDLYDYGASVPLMDECVSGIEGEHPLDSEMIVQKVKVACYCISCVAALIGCYLDRPKNRIGNTGWDILSHFVKGTKLF